MTSSSVDKYLYWARQCRYIEPSNFSTDDDYLMKSIQIMLNDEILTQTLKHYCKQYPILKMLFKNAINCYIKKYS